MIVALSLAIVGLSLLLVAMTHVHVFNFFEDF